MDIFTVFEQLKTAITELNLKLADADAAIAEAKKVAYDEGFIAGVASVPTPGGDEKIYSQAELDQKVAEAIASSEAKVAELEGMVGEIDAKIAEAIAAFKADLKAKYAEQQAAESASESGFGTLLD